MLLEFKAENYRLLRDGFQFSMIPDYAKKDLNYSLLSSHISNKEYYGLCSSVVYGPNAAGKSSIIEALDTFKSIVRNGHVNNSQQPQNWSIAPNPAAFRFDLIPNNQSKETKSVCFCIKFTTDIFLVNYKLELDFGRFLDQNYQHKILKEELYINEDLIFSRDCNIKIADILILKKYKNYIDIENIETGKIIAQKNLKLDELFLTNGFKSIIAPKLAEAVINWFEDKLHIIYHAQNFHIMPVVDNRRVINLPPYIKDIAKSIGLASNNIVYFKENEQLPPALYSVFENLNNIGVIAEAIESYGTLRLINLLLPLMQTFIDGMTLVVDEFDCSLHPMVVMSIIGLFHNPDINKNNAQLIFNTHNPIFLSKDLFRRDEIKFVDRGEDQISELYSLADFPTSGKGSVRNTTEYMKNYFVSRYGAIKDIDFAPIFEKIMKESKKFQENIKDGKLQ